ALALVGVPGRLLGPTRDSYRTDLRLFTAEPPLRCRRRRRGRVAREPSQPGQQRRWATSVSTNGASDVLGGRSAIWSGLPWRPRWWWVVGLVAHVGVQRLRGDSQPPGQATHRQLAPRRS